MSMKFANNDIQSMYFGNNQIKLIYFGSHKIYELQQSYQLEIGVIFTSSSNMYPYYVVDNEEEFFDIYNTITVEHGDTITKTVTGDSTVVTQSELNQLLSGTNCLYSEGDINISYLNANSWIAIFAFVDTP